MTVGKAKFERNASFYNLKSEIVKRQYELYQKYKKFFNKGELLWLKRGQHN